MIINILYITYIAVYRPAKPRKLIFTILVNESFVFVTIMSTFTIGIYDKRHIFNNLSLRNRLGWIIIFSNIGFSMFVSLMTFIDYILLIIFIVKSLIKKYKDKKKIKP